MNKRPTEDALHDDEDRPGIERYTDDTGDPVNARVGCPA